MATKKYFGRGPIGHGNPVHAKIDPYTGELKARWDSISPANSIYVSHPRMLGGDRYQLVLPPMSEEEALRYTRQLASVRPGEGHLGFDPHFIRVIDTQLQPVHYRGTTITSLHEPWAPVRLMPLITHDLEGKPIPELHEKDTGKRRNGIHYMLHRLHHYHDEIYKDANVHDPEAEKKQRLPHEDPRMWSSVGGPLYSALTHIHTHPSKETRDAVLSALGRYGDIVSDKKNPYVQLAKLLSKGPVHESIVSKIPADLQHRLVAERHGDLIVEQHSPHVDHGKGPKEQERRTKAWYGKGGYLHSALRRIHSHPNPETEAKVMELLYPETREPDFVKYRVQQALLRSQSYIGAVSDPRALITGDNPNKIPRKILERIPPDLQHRLVGEREDLGGWETVRRASPHLLRPQKGLHAIRIDALPSDEKGRLVNPAHYVFHGKEPPPYYHVTITDARRDKDSDHEVIRNALSRAQPGTLTTHKTGAYNIHRMVMHSKDFGEFVNSYPFARLPEYSEANWFGQEIKPLPPPPPPEIKTGDDREREL